MLFILAMDPLQRLLDLATQHGILTPLPLSIARWRTSMYTDDVAIFINPLMQGVTAVKTILEAFEGFLGLHINLQKISIHPIGCEHMDLHTRSLQKVRVQPLIERIGQRLPAWKGRWLNRVGRLMLVSSVLSSMPNYHLTVFPLATWARKKIDKIR